MNSRYKMATERMNEVRTLVDHDCTEYYDEFEELRQELDFYENANLMSILNPVTVFGIEALGEWMDSDWRHLQIDLMTDLNIYDIEPELWNVLVVEDDDSYEEVEIKKALRGELFEIDDEENIDDAIRRSRNWYWRDLKYYEYLDPDDFEYTKTPIEMAYEQWLEEKEEPTYLSYAFYSSLVKKGLRFNGFESIINIIDPKKFPFTFAHLRENGYI